MANEKALLVDRILLRLQKHYRPRSVVHQRVRGALLKLTKPELDSLLAMVATTVTSWQEEKEPLP